MAMYVTTGENGLPTGFFDSRIAAAPEGAQAITVEQYEALVAAPRTTTFIAGALGSMAPAAAIPPDNPTLARAAISSGLAITSTGSATALNGTYALSTTIMSLAADLVALIQANGGAFPGGASTWSWPDKAGALHVFPAAATFVAFHQALAAYRLALYGVIWGATTLLPPAAATIP